MKKHRAAFLKGAFIALIVILLFTYSCNSNKPKLFKITGTVTGETEKAIDPLANAEVLLYSIASEDSSVMNLHKMHPSIGALHAKENLFDHRLATPKLRARSDSGGKFELSGVESGNYYVVVFSEGWGFRYLPVSVTDHNITNLDVSLHQVVELPAIISLDYSLLDDRVYRVSSNLALLENAKLICYGFTTLVMDPGTEANLYGNLVMGPSSYLRVLSSDKLYSTSNSAEQIESYNHISVYNNNEIELQNIILSGATYGLRIINSENVTLSNSSIQSRYLSVSLSNVDNASIVNCTVTGSRESSLAAIYCENSQNINIEKSHIYKNIKGISTGNCSSVMISENYFDSNSSIDVSFGEYSTGSVVHCAFVKSNLAISNYKGQIQAHWNDIDANTGIYSYQLLASFSANNNNFDCAEYAIKSRSIFYNSEIIHMNAKQNYWNTTNIREIEALIFDRNDEDTNDVNYSLLKSVVDFQPFRSQRTNAGISE